VGPSDRPRHRRAIYEEQLLPAHSCGRASSRVHSDAEHCYSQWCRATRDCINSLSRPANAPGEGTYRRVRPRMKPPTAAPKAGRPNSNRGTRPPGHSSRNHQRLARANRERRGNFPAECVSAPMSGETLFLYRRRLQLPNARHPPRLENGIWKKSPPTCLLACFVCRDIVSVDGVVPVLPF